MFSSKTTLIWFKQLPRDFDLQQLVTIFRFTTNCHYNVLFQDFIKLKNVVLKITLNLKESEKLTERYSKKLDKWSLNDRLAVLAYHVFFKRGEEIDWSKEVVYMMSCCKGGYYQGKEVVKEVSVENKYCMMENFV